MKPVRLRARARADVQNEVRWYRREAGGEVAGRLAVAFDAALKRLSEQPAIGSTRIGERVGLPQLRGWRVEGFPLLVFYVERATAVDVIRVLGERQDVMTVLALEQTE